MKKFYLCGILFVLWLSTPALATPLSDLIGGNSLTVGDKEFVNWSLGSNVDGFDLSEIYVTGNNTDPLNPGIIYDTSNALSVSGDNEDTYLNFSFDVQTTSGLALIKDNSLEITSYSFSGNGYIGISEYVSDASGPIAVKEVWADTIENSGSLFDYREFTPVSSLSIGTSIYIGTWCDT